MFYPIGPWPDKFRVYSSRPFSTSFPSILLMSSSTSSLNHQVFSLRLDLKSVDPSTVSHQPILQFVNSSLFIDTFFPNGILLSFGSLDHHLSTGSSITTSKIFSQLIHSNITSTTLGILPCSSTSTSSTLPNPSLSAFDINYCHFTSNSLSKHSSDLESLTSFHLVNLTH